MIRIRDNQTVVRTLSAAVMIAVIALILWAGQIAVLVASSIAAVVIGLEIARLAHLQTRFRLVYAALALAISLPLAIGLSFLEDYPVTQTVLLGLTLIAVCVAVLLQLMPLWIRVTDSKRDLPLALGKIYFALSVAFIPVIVGRDDGIWWLVLAAGTVIVADTAAYFIGRLLGKRKLLFRVSPSKTVEGAAAGLVGGTAATVVLSLVLPVDLNPWLAIPVGLAISVLSILGDLFESWLKRRAGVKDSSAIFPGHGGLLDRLDSIAPGLPLIYFVSQW